MGSLFDMYLRSNIMSACETYFNDYLESEGLKEESLTEDDRTLIGEQIDAIIGMIERVYKEYDNKSEAYEDIVDKLIGFFVVAKMNESRLCKLLNEATDKLRDK